MFPYFVVRIHSSKTSSVHCNLMSKQLNFRPTNINNPPPMPTFTISPLDNARRLIEDNLKEHCIKCTKFVHKNINGLQLECCYSYIHLGCVPGTEKGQVPLPKGKWYLCPACSSYSVVKDYFEHKFYEDESSDASERPRCELRHKRVKKCLVTVTNDTKKKVHICSSLRGISH